MQIKPSKSIAILSATRDIAAFILPFTAGGYLGFCTHQGVKVAYYGVIYIMLFERASASQIYLCPAEPDMNRECWLATARQEKIVRLLDVNGYKP